MPTQPSNEKYKKIEGSEESSIGSNSGGNGVGVVGKSGLSVRDNFLLPALGTMVVVVI